MRTIIHAKCIDEKVRLALYGMLEYSATKLFPRRMKYVSIKLHLKHYDYEGEALIEEGTKTKNPRNFKIVIDPYRIEKDDWGRELNYSEWVCKILRTLAHEMVHVKQWAKGEMYEYVKSGLIRFHKTKFDADNINYWDYPWEIEAFGKQLGLFVRFCEDAGIADQDNMQEGVK